MKLCIFSDIHGNGPAFGQAFPKILSEKADFNIYLGDLCGYYYDQLEIFDRLQEIPNLIAIRGNHDSIFLAIVKGKKRNLREAYLSKYGRSIENLLSQDYKKIVYWLDSLPEYYKDPDGYFACFHGSPMDPLNGYIYPDTALELFRNQPEPFIFLGHSHYKMFTVARDNFILNPGSLGQPRDKGLPTYAVVQLPVGEFHFQEIIYDKDSLRKRIEEVGDTNEYLKEIINQPN